LAEIDAEGELLPDGTLLVYVALPLLILFLIYILFFLCYIYQNNKNVIFLTLIYKSFALAGVAKQLQLFILEQGIHQTIIPQNQ
jgi:positive regulator of sigma E activity